MIKSRQDIPHFAEQKFYYFRDTVHCPVITVCILKIGNQISRGIAICHYNDFPCKKIGRIIAQGRAYKAMFECQSSSKVRAEFVPGMRCAWGSDCEYKAVYMPSLTTFERNLILHKRPSVFVLNIPPNEYEQKELFNLRIQSDDKIRMQMND